MFFNIITLKKIFIAEKPYLSPFLKAEMKIY
jgi:hypothetical protein